MSKSEVVAAINTFCWADLVTPDTAGARAFYTDIFGWKPMEIPNSMGAYTMFKKNGSLAAGMMAEPRHGHWAAYVRVASAAASAQQVVALGGKVLKEPFDMGGMGAMVVAEDPTGAQFRLWQPHQEAGGVCYGEPGNVYWNELLTSDTKRAESFYSSLFGWQGKAMDLGPMPYTTFEHEGRTIGGMMTLPEEAKQMGAPPNWLVYFAVTHCDDSVKHITSRGGRVLKPAIDIPGVGRFAILADPQGVTFAVIQP